MALRYFTVQLSSAQSSQCFTSTVQGSRRISFPPLSSFLFWNFHFGNLFFYILGCPQTRLSSPSFKVSIDGNVASAAYNSQLAGSSILLTFCTGRINRICYRLGVCNTTVTVETSTGVYFTCAIKLRISDKFSLTESD